MKKYELEIYNNDYIVRDHRVHGVRIMPGVTFLDIILRILDHEGFEISATELQNVVFSEAVATSDVQDKRIRIQIVGDGEKRSLVGLSKSIANGTELDVPWVENVKCNIVFNREPLQKSIDLKMLKNTSSSVVSLDEMYAHVREIKIEHYEFMKGLGDVFIGDGYLLAEIHLGDLAKTYLDYFYVHPAYLDCSTLVPLVHYINITGNNLDKPYIPLFIESFRAQKKAGEKCYVLMRPKQKVSSLDDILYNDLELYDEQGSLVALFNRLAAKRIRSEELIERLRSVPSSVGRDDMEREKEPQDRLVVAVDQSEGKLGNVIVDELKDMVAEVLGKDSREIKVDVGFYDLGLESTHLLKIVGQLEEKIGEQLYPTLLFEYTNISELSEYLGKEYGDIFVSLPKRSLNDAPPKIAQSLEVNDVDRTEPIGSLPEDEDSNLVGSTSLNHEPVAIIGIAGKYPKSKNLGEFWENIVKGRDCITEIPPNHWSFHEYYGERAAAAQGIGGKWGGFIEDADKFDPLFFKISPRDAEIMDPQLRLLMENAWEVLEDSGHSLKEIQKERVGVFVGVMNDDYTWVAAESYFNTGIYESPGCYANDLANRISYYMNFTGPSLAIETACSSSLTAIHYAKMSIMMGECEMAIAGGVNLSLHRSKYLMLTGLNILSPRGCERAFDAQADGYVPSEGVGLVLLKKLSKAIQDNDHIYAVIKGSAVTHSGTGAGRFVPNVREISRAARRAIDESGVHPEQIGYIETHGTGTELGDPVEFTALAKAVGAYTNKQNYCALGTKSNFGHMESASGVCALTKTLLCMQNNTIPICPNLDKLNPAIPIDSSPFYMPNETKSWKQSDLPRVAAINSYGIGGSNCFMLVEEYNAAEATDEATVHPDGELLVLSAYDETGLRAVARRLHSHINDYYEAKLQGNTQTRDVEREIVKIVAAMSRVCKADIDTDSDVREYSLDYTDLSLLAGQIQRRYGVDVSIAGILRHKSIRKLVFWLIRTYPDKFKLHSKEEKGGAENPEMLDRLYLQNIAYTLQVGRSPMQRRVAIHVTSLSDALRKLSAYFNKQDRPKGIIFDNNESEPLADADSASRHYASLQNIDWDGLGKRWVSGEDVNWNAIYTQCDVHPSRISLPTYPFKSERYWISAESLQKHDQSSFKENALHELIDRNESTLDGLCYRKHFVGNETYLFGNNSSAKELPGMMLLEMVHAASELAGLHDIVSHMNNVQWKERALVQKNGSDVCVELLPSGGSVACSVYDKSIGTNSSDAFVNMEIENRNGLPFAELDQSELKRISDRWSDLAADGGAVDGLDSLEKIYGPSYRGLKWLKRNDHECAAELKKSIADHAYLANTVVFESVLQAIGLMSNDNAPVFSSPASMAELDVVKERGIPKYIYIHSNHEALDGRGTYDVFVFNESREPVIRMKELCVTFQPFEELEGGKHEDILLLAEGWQPTPLRKDVAALDADLLIYSDREVDMAWLKEGVKAKGRIFCVSHGERYAHGGDFNYQLSLANTEDVQRMIGQLKGDSKGKIPRVYLLNLNYTDGSDDINFESMILRSIYALFNITKTLMEQGVKEDVRVLCVSKGDRVMPSFGALSGFAKSIHMENPKYNYKFVTLDKNMSDEEGVAVISDELCNWSEHVEEVRYGGTKRHLRKMSECRPHLEDSPMILREEGVYVITGGVGGVGQLLSHHLSRRYKAKLVLTGRRSLNSEIQMILGAIEQGGGRATYLQCDVGQRGDIKSVLEQCVERYGKINGIIHAAGVVRDAFLLKKKKEEIEEVLMPKICGAINLDLESRKYDMDFIVFFSSVSGVMGNPGQCDYAYANRFMDYYSSMRNDLQVQTGEGTRYLSIAWPFWENGGMKLDEEALKMMRMRTGMGALSSEGGVYAYEKCLRGGDAVSVVLTGDVQKISDSLKKQEMLAEQAEDAVSGEVELIRRTQDYLMSNMRKTLKLKGDISVESDLSEYGLDSITLLEMIKGIQDAFLVKLSLTDFVKHSRLRTMSEFLVKKYRDKIDTFFKQAAVDASMSAEDMSKGPALPTQSLRLLSLGKGHLDDHVRGMVVLKSMYDLESTDMTDLYNNRQVAEGESIGFLRKGEINEIVASSDRAFRMYYPLSSGEKLDVLIAGCGEPVIFLSPMGMATKIWTMQIRKFSSNRRVIAINLPGHGDSDKPHNYSINEIACMVVEFIESMLPNEKVNLIGGSYGGVVAQIVASMLKDTAASLTLVNSFCDTTRRREEVGVPIEGEEDDVDETNRAEKTLIYLNNRSNMDFERINEKRKQLDPEEASLLADIFKQSQLIDPISAFEYAETFSTYNTMGLLSELTIPTMIIVGEKDVVMHPMQADMMNDILHNSQIVKIHDAGHYCFLTHYEKVNQLIEQFLANLKDGE